MGFGGGLGDDMGFWGGFPGGDLGFGGMIWGFWGV